MIFLLFLNFNFYTLWLSNLVYFFSFSLTSKLMSVMLCVIIISSSVFYYSKFYLPLEKNYNYFIILLLSFVLSMLLLLVSKSYFLLFLGWEGLGVSSFLLVVFYKNWKSNNNSLLVFLSNRIGDSIFIIMLAGMIFSNLNISYFLMVLLIITKSAQYPIMSWLPAAMAAPTPVSALVHSSTLVIAGIVFVLKHWTVFYLIQMNMILFLLGHLTLISSSMAASCEKDFKKIIALSTLSQLGLMFIMMSKIFLFIIFFHLISHAFLKSVLFLTLGGEMIINEGEQSKNIVQLNFNVLLMVILQICLFSLSGLIYLCGYYSKDLFIESSMNLNSYFFALLMVLSIGLTFYYSFKILLKMKTKNKMSIMLNSFTFNLSVFFLIILMILFGWWSNKNLFFIPSYLLLNEKLMILFFILLLMLTLLMTLKFFILLFYSYLLFYPSNYLNKGGKYAETVVLNLKILILNQIKTVYFKIMSFRNFVVVLILLIYVLY